MSLPNEEDSRVLTYLAKIAGKLVDLTPPRTRLEIFFAVWAGMNYELPPAPYTRFERFLLAAMGRGELPSGCYTRLELFFNNIAGGVARLPDTDNSLLERYLREIADSGLEGYTRLDYVDFDGTFYYDTGEKLRGSDVITISLSNTSVAGQNVFGAYWSGHPSYSLYLFGNGSSLGSYLRYGNQLYRPVFGSGSRTLTIGAPGTTGFEGNVTIPYEEFTTDANAYIGWLPNSSSPKYTGRINGVITVGNRLRYVPYRRDADGVIVYYESVNGTIIEPSVSAQTSATETLI